MGLVKHFFNCHKSIFRHVPIWSPVPVPYRRGGGSITEDLYINLVAPMVMCAIKPQFFAFRWLTLLLSQEFLLPDVIRIWDSLFADGNRFDFLLLVCCAMLM